MVAAVGVVAPGVATVTAWPLIVVVVVVIIVIVVVDVVEAWVIVDAVTAHTITPVLLLPLIPPLLYVWWGGAGMARKRLLAPGRRPARPNTTGGATALAYPQQHPGSS